MSWIHDTIQIANNLWCIKDVQSINKYLMVGSERALLFDTGFGFIDFHDEITAITDKPLYVVDSHADPDHCLGNYLFEEVYISRYDYASLSTVNQRSFKQEQLEYRLAKPGSTLSNEMGDYENWLNASVFSPNYHLIDDGHVFDLGDIKIHVIALPGHSSGSIGLWDQENQRLFTGDTVMDYNVYYMPAGEPKPRVPEPLMVYRDSLLRLDTIVGACELYPGHGAWGIERSTITEAIEHLELIHNGKAHGHALRASLGYPAIQFKYKTSNLLVGNQILEEYLATPMTV